MKWKIASHKNVDAKIICIKISSSLLEIFQIGINSESFKMGVAYYLETEDELSSFDVENHIDGKCLVMADEHFQNGIYEELDITPLSEFLGGDASEYFDDLDEEIPESAQETWFNASDGLITITAMIEYLESDLSTMPDSDGVIDELKLVEEVLMSCESVGMQWHLAMDI